MTAYYNESDPLAAAWLRELISQGHIAHGIVDDRSIADVRPGDLAGFSQCHFFAGLGAWSLALRYAGWPDPRPVWTGSCPCQPFSTAGKQRGAADARHLWPVWRSLIAECAPSTIFGEQVASRLGRGWLDAVRVEVEAMGYAVGAADLCAASVGAPHIRQRLYFGAKRLVHTHDEGPQGWGFVRNGAGERAIGPSSVAGGMGDANCARSFEGKQAAPPSRHGRTVDPASGWRSVDWVACADGRARPVEPGSFPLVDGAPARVGRLRGYGNAIVPQVAATFIGAFVEASS